MLIVPLEEEFRILCEIFTLEESDVKGGIHYHTLNPPGSGYRAIAVVLGEMGTTPTSQLTEKVLSYLKPKLAILLRFCATLDKDLKLGDTIVASEVKEFLASSKATPLGKSFKFQYSGSNWKTDFAVIKYVQNFEFTDKNLYATWRHACQIFIARWVQCEARQAYSLNARGVIQRRKLTRRANEGSGFWHSCTSSLGSFSSAL